MEWLSKDQFTILANPGVTSVQIVSPHNSQSTRDDHARDRRARHAPTPLALQGAGTLLLDADQTRALQAGEAVRFADGDWHGVENAGSEPFVYLSVTAPPIDFAPAYSKRQ
jgi:uncharacterized cupin superfamily protein